MVTYYNYKDMIDFARHMVSPERRKAFEANQDQASTPLEDRIKDVYASDYQNWLASKKK